MATYTIGPATPLCSTTPARVLPLDAATSATPAVAETSTTPRMASRRRGELERKRTLDPYATPETTVTAGSLRAALLPAIKERCL